MELSHTFTVGAEIGRAWDVLTHVERLSPCVPGDVFKLYLAAAILPAAWKFVGRARGDTRD